VSAPAAPLPAPAPAARPPGRTHTVDRGDTLWDIAHRYYGRGDRWPVIFDANRNKVSSPYRLPIGAVLVIP
ncbi:MAG: LysM peptidoglycan-binding domain-containing protein, partial [Stackebrandtia sp.]